MISCPIRRAPIPTALVAVLLASSLLAADPSKGEDWPQWLGPRRDGVWRETGLIDNFPSSGPKQRWRTPVGGGYAGPAVADGKVYVTDRVLDRGERNPDNPFTRTPTSGKERVLCLDEATGKELWKHEYPCKYEIQYPAGPRTTPVVAGGKVYTLGAMGDLYCLDVRTGKPVWSKNFPKDYEARVPIWGFSSHPLLDGDKLICLVGGKGSVVVAFHKDTGKELWKSLDLDRTGIGYSPPMIYEVGKTRQLIVWTPEAVNSLDPETGKKSWSQPFFSKADLTAPTPRLSGDMLFVTAFYNGSLMLKLDRDKPAASVLWKGKGRSEKPDQTDALHSIMPTPVIKGGYIYGVCSYGELRCLKADTGERKWMDLTATGTNKEPVRWANAFLIEQGDRFWLFNEQGELIIAKLTPQKYEELGRAKLLEPTGKLGGGRVVLWSHPAFANRSIYARNDREIVCYSLAKD
jgi:outer membrane protein assembly factor BamB